MININGPRNVSLAHSHKHTNSSSDFDVVALAEVSG